MKMTTVQRDFRCPKCARYVEVETEGLLGGLIAQIGIARVFERAKKEGATITCSHCGYEWWQKPK